MRKSLKKIAIRFYYLQDLLKSALYIQEPAPKTKTNPDNRPIYVVKANIRNYTTWGNQKWLRRGSLHFLPGEEVFLCSTKDLSSRHRKISVRGKHKSGYLRTRNIHARFLQDLRLEKIEEPSAKTLRFIKNNGLYHIKEEKKLEQNWQYLINEMPEIQAPEIKAGLIEDPVFLAAQKFLKTLKTAIDKKDKKFISQNLIHYPLILSKRKNYQAAEISDSTQLEKNFRRIFNKTIIFSILDTDVDTIFPTKDKLLIGRIEVKIKSANKIKIDRIYI